MDQYQLIRHLFAVEGLSQREIARRLNISRNTVKRYCKGENVPWERQKPKEIISPVVTNEVLQFILDCFEADREAGRKQVHTARRIYDRLRSEKGFTGGESTVRRVVAELRQKTAKAFVPLQFAPGEAAQIDWGTAKVFIGGKKLEANLFCARLCNSCAPYVVAFPSQREEAFWEGHQRTFSFFSGVSRYLVYDNLKTAVKDGWGKMASQQDKFLAFRAHYAYEARFCNPAEGHEKGLVENLVGYIRRNVLVPIPRVSSWNELNELLEKRCREYIGEHTIRGRELSVNDALAIEKRALTTLPGMPYETAKVTEVKSDYFSTVPFDKNRYSIPVRWAHQTVTVKASAFEVNVYFRGEEIANHERCYAKGQTKYRLEHYISLLEKRPRSVFNAKPVLQASLPLELELFAKRTECPDKSMVRLLRIVVDEGKEKVVAAIRKAVANQQYSVEVVYSYTKESASTKLCALDYGPKISPVDLSNYDELLLGGDAACR